MRGFGSGRGIALPLVLWFVSAMSLLVAGIVSQAKIDLKLAQVHAAQSIATATGDGATLLFLADLMNESSSDGRFTAERTNYYQVGSTQVLVEALPVNVLINIRTASTEVLKELLFKRGIDRAEAELVAESISRDRSIPIPFPLGSNTLSAWLCTAANVARVNWRSQNKDKFQY